MFDLKKIRAQIPPTQEEIIKNWKMVDTSCPPVVSVVCTAFNHESFIEDALKSFLLQKTDFPFEVIVHDDASTDKTAAIINYYAKKYPLIVKPILQIENQYTINGHIPSLNTIEAAKGKYIAFCEGDDFWLTTNKLQNQYDALEANVKSSLCFTPSLELDESTQVTSIICFHYKKRANIPASSAIIGRGGYMPTASLFFRAEYSKYIIEHAKSWAIGDFFIQSYLALAGEVVYLPTTSCVYRRNTESSWTNTQKAKHQRRAYSIGMVRCIPYFQKKLRHKRSSEYLIVPFIYYSRGALASSSNIKEFLLSLSTICYFLFMFSPKAFPKYFANKILKFFVKSEPK